MPDQPLLTTAELARRLRISARTLQRWRRDGWITPDLVTVGGQARWTEESVRAQLREIAAKLADED